MARRKSTPRRPEPPPTGVLNWRDSAHWDWDGPLPCRYQCGGEPTQLRDSKRQPAHKVCAELAIAQQIQEYAEAYENENERFQL
ncbi:hypothetical protein [Streptomyces parvulus]|uniref:hypothetical protein n=1 Tax=Streptomyces parvulus TaxID=146923 RepID=UPI00380628D0